MLKVLLPQCCNAQKPGRHVTDNLQLSYCVLTGWWIHYFNHGTCQNAGADKMPKMSMVTAQG